MHLDDVPLQRGLTGKHIIHLADLRHDVIPLKAHPLTLPLTGDTQGILVGRRGKHRADRRGEDTRLAWADLLSRGNVARPWPRVRQSDGNIDAQSQNLTVTNPRHNLHERRHDGNFDRPTVGAHRRQHPPGPAAIDSGNIRHDRKSWFQQ